MAHTSGHFSTAVASVARRRNPRNYTMGCSRSAPTVLIIGEHEPTRRALAASLEPSYRVQVTPFPGEAVFTVATGKIDIVIVCDGPAGEPCTPLVSAIAYAAPRTAIVVCQKQWSPKDLLSCIVERRLSISSYPLNPTRVQRTVAIAHRQRLARLCWEEKGAEAA